ncbi:ABC transporter permease [Lentilactobacillus kosonis]|uniref:ABC-type multidrug/protein/lipid transport system, ATPase component n=1 Tax=Lentilactobacillus kosonis TaxID=2810561 RepID=A0A401FLU4_9LACO|nr:ABC transporter ATP-binding protein [Lentilactobacillus kosonis]GAY73340.1 ABC-type multidrug/protein/lipid transport system, ATPase component [Lentilactobacillus kosonis]
MIILTVLSVILGTVASVFSPKILGDATNIIFAGAHRQGGINFSSLETTICILVGLYVVTFLTSFLQQRFMVVITQSITQRMRRDLRAKLNRLPISYFDQHQNGELMSIATNDVDNIVNGFQQSITSIISSVITFVGVFIMMITISPILTLIVCIIIPGMVLITRIITPRTQQYNMNYFGSLGKLNSQVEESLQGFTVIKSFNGTKNAFKKFDSANEAMVKNG